MTAFVLITFDNPAHNRVSCHGDNKPQGWCTSLTFIARSQLHFHNNSISSFPGGLWLTAPEKITDSLLFSKLKGVGLSPVKCGGEVEGENSFHDSTQQNPSALEWWREGVRFSWAQAEPRAQTGRRWHRVAVHSSAICQAKGGLAPVMGHHGWMPCGVGGEKMAPLCFQHSGWVLWHRFVILAVLAMDKYKTTIYILRQTGSDMMLLLFALLNWANRKRQQLQWWEWKMPLLVLVLTAISLTRDYQLIWDKC